MMAELDIKERKNLKERTKNISQDIVQRRTYVLMNLDTFLSLTQKGFLHVAEIIQEIYDDLFIKKKRPFLKT